MSNRVEELERQVAELQAAVNGLTEELVEMKERVRQLEDRDVEGDGESADRGTSTDADPEPTAQPSAGPTQVEPTPKERTTVSDDHVDVVEQTEDGSSSVTEASNEGTDVRVPEQQATTPDAEAGASEGEQSEEGDGESEDSDIIVA